MNENLRIANRQLDFIAMSDRPNGMYETGILAVAIAQAEAAERSATALERIAELLFSVVNPPWKDTDGYIRTNHG